MSRIDRGMHTNEGGERGNVILIAGVSGVGKTHHVKKARGARLIPKGVRIVNFGTVLARELRGEGVQFGTKDEITTLDPVTVDRGIRSVVRRTMEHASNVKMPHLVTGHIVYRQGTELVSLLDLYKDLGAYLAGIITVTGYPYDIFDRRRDDPRSRYSEPPRQIADHQATVFDATLMLAQSLGIEMRPVMSRKRQLGVNLLHLADEINDLTS